jgi:hypothetical protein
MHRSSESIAALAAALAKAQSELSNPEKSLIGTVGGDRPGEGARTGSTLSAKRLASSRSRQCRRPSSIRRRAQ